MDRSDSPPEPAATEKVEQVPVGQLKPYPNNARTHSPRQIKQIARSIERFGFVNPVLADANGQIIAGHGRVEAAKQLGLTSVPVLRIEHLSPAEIRAYTLADNRLAEKAGWDQEMLAIELQGLNRPRFRGRAHRVRDGRDRHHPRWHARIAGRR